MARRAGDPSRRGHQLAQLARLVTAAQAGKAPVQRLADWVSSAFVPVGILLAVGVLAAWLLTGTRRRRRSPPRWRCSSSPARPRSASPPPPRCWSGPASEHSIARAVVSAATEQGALPEVADFAKTPGLGVSGVVDNRAVLVGRPPLLAEWSQPLTAELTEALRSAEAAGQTVVAVAWDGAARGLLVVAGHGGAT